MTEEDVATQRAAREDRSARLALNRVVEPGDTAIGRLLTRHGPAEVLAAVREVRLADLEPDPGRRARLAERGPGLRLRLEPGAVEAGLAAADRLGARFIAPGDPAWPPGLDDLGEQRPIGLWVLGHWPVADESVSVVGARACTGYGAYVAGAMGADLASAGAAVVSGAALGVDAAAHRGALAVRGPTVAVLACGIDQVYPRAHEALLRTIGERGAVLAELSPGSTPTRFRFLHRNRLIAALGTGTVVIEAARRSGSLVTARLAGELGRVVMAVPGPVTSDLSAGTHELIRDGATLVVRADQALEACRGIAAPPSAPRAGPQRERAPAPLSRIDRARRGGANLVDPADRVARLVAEALPTSRAPAGCDVLTLARTTGIEPDAVFAALGRLAAQGLAVRSGSGWTLAQAT